MRPPAPRDRPAPSNLLAATQEPFLDRYKRVLSRALGSWQVLFMTYNIVFGVGFFQNTTYTFQIAGTINGSIAFIIVGVIALCVVGSISEMLAVFPIVNPLVEYVRAFVDEDLAALIGTAYWLSYAAIFNSLIISAVNLLDSMTNMSYALLPVWLILILTVNVLPVRKYGNVEVIFGLAKVGVVVILIVSTAYGSARGASDIGTATASDFRASSSRKSSSAQDMFMALCLATTPFVGIESVATMSAESRNTPSVVRSMGIITLSMIVVGAVVTSLTGWIALNHYDILAAYTNQGFGGIVPPPRKHADYVANIPSTIAALSFSPIFQRALDGLLVFSAVSAANTALYVASRTLFGATREHSFENIILTRFFGRIGEVNDRSRVPVQATVWTFLVLLWMTILNVVPNSTDYFSVFQLATNMAIVTCLIIWATQCIAFIRFHQLRVQHKALQLTQLTSSPKVRGWFWSLQPIPAWIGLVGCNLLLFVFSTAIFWDKSVSGQYVWTYLGVYLSPMLGAFFWLMLKIFRAIYVRKHKDYGPFRLYVHFNNVSDFKKVIWALQSRIHEADYRVEQESPPPPPNQNKIRGQPVPIPPPYCAIGGLQGPTESQEQLHTRKLTNPPYFHWDANPPHVKRGQETDRIEPDARLGVDAIELTPESSRLAPLRPPATYLDTRNSPSGANNRRRNQP